MHQDEMAAGRRRFLGASGGLVGAAALGLPGLARSQGSNTLNVGLIRAPGAGVIELTSTKGWFKEAGVPFEGVLFAAASGPKIVQAMGGGGVHVGMVNTTGALLAAAGGGIPLRFISICTDPSRLFAVIGTPTLDSIPKLAGKRVACTAGTGLHYFLARVLAKFNMTLKDIEFVNLPAAEGQSAFIAGRVDAIVPSVNGRFYLMANHKDAREIFTHGDFTKPPGSTAPFQNYDLFLTTEPIIQSHRKQLQGFLAAYHDRGVPFVNDPATRPEALRIITDYVNKEQKNPTDTATMQKFMDNSGFFDRKTTRQLMTDAEFRAGIEYQVKFFTDLGQMKGAVDLDKAIVTDLL